MLLVLPYQENESIQLERKRHIGNDICVLIFNEGDDPIPSSFIQSEFLTVFLVVSPVFNSKKENKEVIGYRFDLAVKECTPAFGPSLPKLSYYIPKARSSDIRKFIITKCISFLLIILVINGEISSYYQTQFVTKLKKARSDALSFMADKF